MQGTELGLGELPAIRSKLVYLAWRRYRIASEEAEDVVQTAFATYLEVRDRYSRTDNHAAILVGIFRNKCREYIDRIVREKRRAEGGGNHRLPPAPPETREHEISVLEDVVRREEGRLILAALDDLRPEARDLLEQLLEEEGGRQAILKRLSLNKNTLDSRLHAYRAELRRLLLRKGIHI